MHDLHDWTIYQGKYLLVFCSVDAVIPMWAHMLVAAHAEPFALTIIQGNKEEFLKLSYLNALSKIDFVFFLHKIYYTKLK